MRAARLGLVIATAAVLAGCMGNLYRGSPNGWFAAHNAVAPRENGLIVVCHGFGCERKTAFRFGPADLKAMRKALGAPRSAAEEREGIRRMVAWAETRVAVEVGSAGDVGGLDLWNAGVAGQMDCIDEATNTTSYLMVAADAGLLRHHTVGRPVARGYFLDGRYPHATAVVVSDTRRPWAVDSWRRSNGMPPEVMPLPRWFERSPRD